jgi:hypothetical protein
MSHCVDFWHKWRKEPNFCGLSPQSVSEIKGYLELVDKIKKAGIPEDTIYEKCTSGACRPLLRLADDETRVKGVNYVISSLKRGEKITGGDLQSSINAWLGKETVCKVPTKPAPESTQLRTNENQTVEEKPKEPEADCTSLPVPEDPIRPTLAPCQMLNRVSNFICPDGRKHIVFSDPKNRKGEKCDLWGQFLNQIPGNECWLDAKARKDAEREKSEPLFQRASGLVPPKSTQPLPTISKHPLLKTRQEQDLFANQFIDNCLTDRYHRVIRDALNEHDDLQVPLDAICKGLDLLSEYGDEP